MTELHVGSQLREWRQRRRMSQLELACEAEISSRHLSFVETGRSSPSREMVLLLAAKLEIPHRERNVLLVAAGYAPMFSERRLDDPALSAARSAIDLMLASHAPYPAYAVDRLWNVVASNGALLELFEGVSPALITDPLNILRVSLHPEGVAPRILNFPEWSAHVLARLAHQVSVTADRGLIALYEEVSAYPRPRAQLRPHRSPEPAVLVPLRVTSSVGTLSFLSTTMVFGTPIDVTLSELAIESILPADEDTVQRVAELVRRRAGSLPPT